MAAGGDNPGENPLRSLDFKDVLRDIYYSEDLKIQSNRCKKISATIEDLCTRENGDFCAVYKIVSEEIKEKRKKVTAKQKLFQAAYLYQVEKLPAALQRLGNEEEGSMSDIILWQMIVDRLFRVDQTVDLPVHPAADTARQLSQVEENAIYYAAGYVVYKLIKRYRQSTKEKATKTTGALLAMVGQDAVGDMCQDATSYLDYVKTWTRTTDRGGLRHVSDDTYKFFIAIELITYKLILAGEQKEKIMCEVMGDENVKYLWEIASDLSDEKLKISLLREVTQEWFTIRGFSIVSQLLEQYKLATKKNIKGTKGTRKELH